MVPEDAPGSRQRLSVDPRLRKVTIEQLLTHRAGFGIANARLDPWRSSACFVQTVLFSTPSGDAGR